MIGGLILYTIFNNCSIGVGNLGANGFGSVSSKDISLVGALIVEVVLTCIFVLTVLFASSDKDNKLAGLVIGLSLTLVHLIGIQLTGTSVNPARSFGPALLQGGTALSQYWVFLVAPLIGSVLAAIFYHLVLKEK